MYMNIPYVGWLLSHILDYFFHLIRHWHVHMVKIQCVDLVTGRLWNDKLPRGRCDPVLLQMVDHLDAVLSHQKRSLRHVLVGGHQGVVVEFFYDFYDLVRLPLLGRRLKLFHGPFVSHMTMVEVV